MNVKIAGVLIFLAGTATVFAATHASLNENNETRISGIAGFVDGVGNQLNMEMEFVGLQPNSLYVARLENTLCQNISANVSSLPGGEHVAAFVESNQFGAYSNILKGLPDQVMTAQSVALYSDFSAGQSGGVSTVYCVDLG